MYKRPLKYKQAKNINSFCHSGTFKKDDTLVYESTFGACHSGIKGNSELKNGGYLLLYVRDSSMHYTLTSLKRWIKFLGKVGFKAILVETKPKTLKCSYYIGVQDGDFHIVKFDMKDYFNTIHLFAAVTAFRYIYYAYSNNFTQIPERAFEIKKIYGDNIENIQAITLAYHTLNCWESNHAFIGSRDWFCKVTQEEFDKEMKNQSSVNASLKNDILTESKSIREAWGEKDYKKLADLIQIKYE